METNILNNHIYLIFMSVINSIDLYNPHDSDDEFLTMKPIIPVSIKLIPMSLTDRIIEI